MEDIFLIDQVIAGNRNAFKLLVIRYQRPLFSFFRKFRFAPQKTEELVQEVFLKIFKYLSTFDASKGTFRSWTFSIAKNLALNELKEKDEILESENELDQLSLDAGVAEGPEFFLDKKISSEKVQKMVMKIPNPFKTTVILSYIEELTLNEIAMIEKCSIGTVKSRIYRGKLLLRNLVACEEI